MKAAALLIGLIFCSCSSKESKTLDGKILKDSDGNYYETTLRPATDVFRIEKIDKNKYKEF